MHVMGVQVVCSSHNMMITNLMDNPLYPFIDLLNPNYNYNYNHSLSDLIALI